MRSHYGRLELTLQRLCGLLDHPDFDQELKLARDFLDHGEYGLALQTLVEAMTTYDRRPSTLEYDLIQQAAEAMKLPEDDDDEMKIRFDWLAENVTPPS